jgi:hypothetical protein
MQQVIDLGPVYHRREDRIRANVVLCWLALLLARIAENAAGQTWPEPRRELDGIHIGTFTDGCVAGQPGADDGGVISPRR